MLARVAPASDLLKHVRYLKHIVVGVDGANAREWRRARRIFAQLPQPPTLLWNDGPRMQKLLKQLEEAELSTGPGGKGRNVWLCFGYVLASEQARMVAVHDCDIVTYNRELLARLCYPVAHPAFGFDFCKGYYARVSTKLNGRVMRLFVTPLLRALKSIVGPHPFLVYLDTFRYALSGEVAMDIDLVRRNRIPYDWGLEVGMLAEVFRNSAPRAICQAELCDNYDHKHQELSARDSEKGLNRMAVDIKRSIFRRMASEGIRLDQGPVRDPAIRLHPAGRGHAAGLRRGRGDEWVDVSAARRRNRRGHLRPEHPRGGQAAR